MNRGMSIKGGTLIITIPDGADIERVEVNEKMYTLPSRDCVDRQEAIEEMAGAIWRYPNELYKTLCHYQNAKDLAEYGLKDVPSAEPERMLFLHGDESVIEILSELRSWFSCFDENEGLAYHALSFAIKAVKAQAEIIRCKDCKHWYSDADSGMACEFTNMSQPEDGYCNWAERRTDNESI